MPGQREPLEKSNYAETHEFKEQKQKKQPGPWNLSSQSMTTDQCNGDLQDLKRKYLLAKRF